MGGVEFLEALQSRHDAGDFHVIATSGDVRAARGFRCRRGDGKSFEIDARRPLLIPADFKAAKFERPRSPGVRVSLTAGLNSELVAPVVRLPTRTEQIEARFR
jgi:hypothetical protein